MTPTPQLFSNFEDKTPHRSIVRARCISVGRKFLNHKTFLMLVTAVSIYSCAHFVFAAARNTPFTPGQTIDPGTDSQPCGPLDTNCFPSAGSITSITGSGGTTGLTLTGGPITTAGTLTLGGTLGVANGGTGQTTYTDGQLLIGNSTGNTLTEATLSGTSNEISITNGHGSITLSTPQPIGTASTPTFASTTLSNFTPGSIPFFAYGGSLNQNNANLFWDNTNMRLGIGSSTPGYPLSVNGAGYFGGNLTTTGTLTLSGVTGSTQCLHVNNSGAVSGTGSDCGGGSFSLPITITSPTWPVVMKDSSNHTLLQYSTSTATLGSYNGPVLSLTNSFGSAQPFLRDSGGASQIWGALAGNNIDDSNGSRNKEPMIGSAACYNATLGEVLCLGNSAGYSVSGLSQVSTAIGQYAGADAYTMTEDTYIGGNSGHGIMKSNDNTQVGAYWGYYGSAPYISDIVSLGVANGVAYMSNSNGMDFNLSMSAGGSVDPGFHIYYLACKVAGGEIPCAQHTSEPMVISGTQTINLTNIPVYTGPLSYTGRVLYRTKTIPLDSHSRSPSGAPLYIVANLNTTDTTYTDTAADSSLSPRTTKDASNSICIGDHCNYYMSNVAVIGSSAFSPISDVYLGCSPYNSTSGICSKLTIHSTGAQGVDTIGADLALSPGQGTGVAAGGKLLFQTTPIGGVSGYTYENSPITRMVILPNGNIGIGTSSPSNILEVSGNTFLGGNLTATGTLTFLNTGTSTFSGGIVATCFATSTGGSCIVPGTGGGGGSTSPGGSNFNIQFNNSGSFGGTGSSTLNGLGNAYFAGNMVIGTTSTSTVLTSQFKTVSTNYTAPALLALSPLLANGHNPNGADTFNVTYPAGNWTGIIDNRDNDVGGNGLFVGGRYGSSNSTIFELGMFNAVSGAYTSEFKVTGDAAATFNGVISAKGLTIPQAVGGNLTSFSLSANAQPWNTAFIGNAGGAGVTIGNTNTTGTSSILSVNSGVTYTSNLPTGQGTTRFTVLSNGKVGIGTTSPGTTLDVAGDITDENVMGCNGGSGGLGTTATGTVYCQVAFSDARLKNDISSLDSQASLNLVNSLNPVSFYWKDPSIPGSGSTQEQFGFLAQDVAKVAPNLVATTSPTYLTPDGTFYLNYQGVIPLLAKAIQAQQGEINTATSSLSTLTLGQNSLASAASTTSVTLSSLSAQVNLLSANTTANQSSISNLQSNQVSTSTIVSTTATTLSTSTSFIQTIANAVQSLIQSTGNWIVNQVTAVSGIFTHVQSDSIQSNTIDTNRSKSDTMETNNLCVDDVCVNKDQLKALLIQAGGVSSSSPNRMVATTTPPSDPTASSTSSTTASTSSDSISTSTPISNPIATSTDIQAASTTVPIAPATPPDAISSSTPAVTSPDTSTSTPVIIPLPVDNAQPQTNDVSGSTTSNP
jgi:hypothetical protein